MNTYIQQMNEGTSCTDLTVALSIYDLRRNDARERAGSVDRPLGCD